MQLYRALCLMFLGTLFSPFLLFHECRELKGYKFPVYTTETCPRNETEWEERSAVFFCRGDSSYACLPNENITELLEFCYPLEVISIHPGICLFLRKDKSVVDSYDCKVFKHGCPTGPYFGETVYKYPSCVSIGNGCFLAEPSCKSATQQPKQERPQQSNKSELIWIPSLLGGIVLSTAFFISIAIYRRKRSNHRQQTDEEENPETHQLLSHKDKDRNEIALQLQQNSQKKNQQTVGSNALLSQDCDSDFRLAKIGELEHPQLSSVQTSVTSSQIVQNQEILSTVSSSDSSTTNPNEIVMYGTTLENVNLFRIARLILDLCNDAMRDLMQSKIPGGEIELTKKIASSQADLASCRLSREQKLLLFPPNNGQVQYQSLDFTLMYALVRNIFHEEIEPNSRKNNKWGKKPTAVETGLVVAIENIRECRNAFFAHASSTKVDKKTFDELWTTIEGAVDEIDNHIDKSVTQKCYKKEVDKMKTDPIDSMLHKELGIQIEKYKNLLKKEDETDEKLEELLSIRGKCGRKTLEYEEIFRQWQEDDALFVTTTAAKEVDNVVETNNLVIVAGHSGSGKSAIIQHIALRKMEQGWVVKPMYSVEEIHHAYKSRNFKENKTIFVFNDPIGKDSFDEFQYNAWGHYRETLNHLIRHVKLLLSCRKSVLFDPRADDFFKETRNIIDINEKHIKLSKEEKRLMLDKHLFNVQPTKDDFEKILQIDTYFPLLCKICSSKPKQPEDILPIFLEPVAVLTKEIKSFKNKDKKKYCALVCLVLFNDKLCLKDLMENTALFFKSLQLCELLSNTSPTTIFKELETIEGFFVKRIGKTYNFYHDFVMEVTTFVLGTEHPEETLKCADVSFLRKRICLKKTATNEDFIIMIDDEHIDGLVSRLFDELFGDRFLEVVLNPCLKEEKVSRCLIKRLENDKVKWNMLLDAKETKTEYQEIENDFKKMKEHWYSRLHFVNSERNISPLFALIVFQNNDLSRFCLHQLTQNKMENTPLFAAACCNGDRDLFQIFTEQGINKCLQQQWANFYPIHIASLFHNYDLLDEIIKNNTDVNMFSNHEQPWTPLLLASANAVEEIGKHALISTTAFKRDETVKRLLQKGANVNLCNKVGASPLYMACQNGHESTAKLLLINKAEVNLCKTNGASPLYIAHQKGHSSIEKLLLKHGADLKLRELNPDLTV
ncbi:uncharacterized protein LOC111136086 [Crassostrea virginica]